MSPLGSKEPNEPFLLRCKVAGFSIPHKSAYSVFAPPPQWRCGSHIAAVGFPANRTVKLSKLSVLADRRPGGLNELTSKPPISDVGDRAPIDPIPRGVLGWHQAQKASQLPDIVNFTPVSNARQKLASDNPADPRNAHQVGNGLRQFGIFFTEPANLFGAA